MTTIRPLLPMLLATLLAGGAAHAGELSLGGARLLAENSTQSSVDVTVTFTDRGHALQTAEGGDASTRSERNLRGADAASNLAAPTQHADAPAPKIAEPVSGADAPHGVSISPTAIKRPSYRWQSLVPGTIK
jgi:hypothetical protein